MGGVSGEERGALWAVVSSVDCETRGLRVARFCVKGKSLHAKGAKVAKFRHGGEGETIGLWLKAD